MRRAYQVLTSSPEAWSSRLAMTSRYVMWWTASLSACPRQKNACRTTFSSAPADKY